MNDYPRKVGSVRDPKRCLWCLQDSTERLQAYIQANGRRRRRLEIGIAMDELVRRVDRKRVKYASDTRD